MKVLDKDQQVTKATLASLYRRMQEEKDFDHAEKILDLYEKQLHSQFHVSFTGHFSAGKSSMINYLLGKELLPKSPIPTSANIVKITSGAGVARVFFNEQKPVEYEEPYDIDIIKDFCTTKDTISQIEIHTSEPIVPPNRFIVDTPGIDAADDADRFMTESSLHLVDILYYVMDYNHVQSEINFTFLKQIQEKGIPIYLIINQVDKHNEAELSFSEFKSRVEQSFQDWAIYPEKIYYSSVMDLSLPFNDLQVIKEDLFQLLHQPPEGTKRLTEATEQVVQSHIEWLEKKYQPVEETGDSSFDLARWEALETALQDLDQQSSKFEESFQEEVEQTLKNAYIMPAKIRDLAEQFLLSQETGFKVGFFQAKKKTALEKEKRLTNFYEALEKSIQSTIVWRLREKFAELLHDYEIASDELREKAQQFDIPFTEENVFDALKEGAKVNGQYVLNYTNELSNQIKLLAKREAQGLLDLFKAEVEKQAKGKATPLLQEKESLAIERSRYQEEQAQTDAFKDKLEKLHQLVNEVAPDNSEALANIEEAWERRQQFVKEEAPTSLPKEELVVKTEAIEEKVEESAQANWQAEEIISKIDYTLDRLQALPDFDRLIVDLKEKKQRIENRELTIALFGAFSAGKSSFSNALIGERVLPVSPNPTTAVINRIRPPKEGYPSGSVVISYKTETTLMDDLLTITKDLSPKATDFHGFVDWVAKEKVQKNEQLSHVYQSYLEAILKGYEERQEWLGKEEEISLEDFSAYVTDESIAAYIEAVDLYHENALTAKGITLVDTPGANSVNARHTNVAFDYIKDADAILYVTYYNHAVTSADRDFLIQLGRVKESFELDKMFFIVNAADLAKDDEELRLVLDYVEEQLLQYGIRNPQIYPLSSKRSLEEKEAGEKLNEQMTSFEKRFGQFIEYDLHLLTYESALWDIDRAQRRLTQIIEAATLDQQEKEKAISNLEADQKKAEEELSNRTVQNLLERTEERIERQLHFVKERLYIRFHDMFQEHFNPTTVTENGREARRQLERNRNRLVDYVGYELLQEVRAVSLRIEAFMNQLYRENYEQLRQQLIEINPLITLPNYEEKRFETPDYIQAFEDISYSIFNEALQVFRNLRSFFEQNERERMKEKFYEALLPEIEAYLSERKEEMVHHYLAQAKQFFEALIEKSKTEVASLIEQQINVLNEPVDVERYDKILKEIEGMMKSA